MQIKIFKLTRAIDTRSIDVKIKIKNKEIQTYLDIESPDFPKFVTPLLNLANQYAQGTRPKIVGQMTDLVQEFTGKTLAEWEKWYLSKRPEAIRNATERILKMLSQFKNALNQIDKTLVEKWVRDLVIVKTYIGLRFHDAILKKATEITKTVYRLAEPDDEARGIDGYVGDTPVSIKPETYKMKAGLPEGISVKMIFYKKIKGGIEVDYGEII